MATKYVSPQCALKASKMSEKLLTVKDLWRKKGRSRRMKRGGTFLLILPPSNQFVTLWKKWNLVRSYLFQEKGFSNFSCMFLNPNIFSNLNSNRSNLSNIRKQQFDEYFVFFFTLLYFLYFFYSMYRRQRIIAWICSQIREQMSGPDLHAFTLKFLALKNSKKCYFTLLSKKWFKQPT